ARFAALMHEAAHRLLFRNRRVNDWVGRWLLGFPAFTPVDLYRRGHMAHHRDEFGPDEPDIPLYRGYPIGRASMRRKLTRDATSHTVRQSPWSRFFMVPHHIGWHLAHHVDSGIPMANLPKLHAELRRADYVTDAFEYRSYLALWKQLAR